MDDVAHLWCPHCRWQYMMLPTRLLIADESGLTREEIREIARTSKRGHGND